MEPRPQSIMTLQKYYQMLGSEPDHTLVKIIDVDDVMESYNENYTIDSLIMRGKLKSTEHRQLHTLILRSGDLIRIMKNRNNPCLGTYKLIP